MKVIFRRLAIAGLGMSLAGVGWTVGGVSGSMATSNGTTSATNPSSVGGSNMSADQAGGGVGTGTVSKANTGQTSNMDEAHTIQTYGANSPQAKAAAAQRNHAASRSAITTPTGQTRGIENGTFAPALNSGSAGTTTGVGTAAGMATGTGTGTNTGSTNGSPPVGD